MNREPGAAASSSGALPPWLRRFVIVITALNAFAALLFVLTEDWSSLSWTLAASAAVYACYFMLLRRHNWARIALVILTFPIGLMLLGPEARAYCARPH
jgi:membrane-bound acyltransferase YfiQ involved in biofilm formation